MFRRNKDSTLAIDLAPDAVRVLDVRFHRGAPRISAVLEAPVEAGAGGKADAESLPDRHLAALGGLLEKHRLRSHRCIAAVPTNLVMTRSVAVDSSKPQSADDQIRQTLQNCVSTDVRDLVFDSWPVSQPAEGPGNRTQEMLVVATQRSIVQRYLSGFTHLKLSCAHLDVAPCALADLIVRLLPQAQAEGSSGMVGTVVLSENLGYFAVIERQRVLFWRPFELSGAARNSQQAGMGRVGDEISKCVSHMVGSLHLDGMNEILAFGRGVYEGEFSSYLHSRFNLPIHAPSPFQALPANLLDGDVAAGLEPAAASGFATAVGLMLQDSPIPGGLHG